MPEFVTSSDGTKIAFEKLGRGPTLIVIGGLFCDCAKMRPLAQAFSSGLGVINYDRRGRGESSDNNRYTVDSEIADIAALIDMRGGSAFVYGHSSGAGLALEAAAAGLPIDALILHEPPYSSDGEESRESARQLAFEIRRKVEDGDSEGAIATFFQAMGMPQEVVTQLAGDPATQAIAPTMPYDFQVMGEFHGGGIPVEKSRSIQCPTLILSGSASPDFFRDTAERLASLIPNATRRVIDGGDHESPPDVVAPHVLGWLDQF